MIQKILVFSFIFLVFQVNAENNQAETPSEKPIEYDLEIACPAMGKNSGSCKHFKEKGITDLGCILKKGKCAYKYIKKDFKTINVESCNHKSSNCYRLKEETCKTGFVIKAPADDDGNKICFQDVAPPRASPPPNVDQGSTR